MLVFNKKYFLAAALLFITEVVIAIYFHDKFIRPFLGDFLVVILLYCSIKAVINSPVIPTAIAVLLFSYTLEVLQHFKLVERIGLGDSKIANIVIGTTFQWGDIVAYTLGIGCVIAIEKLKRSESG